MVREGGHVYPKEGKYGGERLLLRGAVGRADLLVSLALLEQHGDRDGLERADEVAKLFGFAPKPRKERQPHAPLRPPQDDRFPSKVTRPFVTKEDEPAVFFRVQAREVLPASEHPRTDIPAWLDDTRPLTAAPRPPTSKVQLSFRPLIPWPRWWPFLKRNLSVDRSTAAIDIAKVVEQFVAARPLVTLPRQSSRQWANRIFILVDYAHELFPFWEDFNDLAARLQRLHGRGSGSFVLISLLDGSPDGRWARLNARGRRVRLEVPEFGEGDLVLALSDLGCSDGPGRSSRRSSWRCLGQLLQARGVDAIALMPYSRRLWDPELCRLFQPVEWDRFGGPPKVRRPPPVPSRSTKEREYVAHYQGGEGLLSRLAPALRIEPRLLRAVRIAAGLDVASEVLAWNHPDVGSELQACWIHPHAVAKYRERFSALAAHAREVTERLLPAAHAHLSPVIAMEEEFTLTKLAGGEPPREAARTLARQLVRTRWEAERSLKESGFKDHVGALNARIDAWSRRFGERIDPQLWQEEEFAALWWMQERKRLPRQGEGGEARPLPAGFDLAKVAWIDQGQEGIRGQVAVMQRGNTLVSMLRDAGENRSPWQDSRTTQVATLAVAGGSVLRVERGSGGCAVPLDGGVIAEGELEEPIRIRGDVEVVTITPFTRPSWAEAVTRSPEGLQARLPDGREVVWREPGEYGLTQLHLRGQVQGSLALTSDRSRIGTYHLPSGFWVDREQATSYLLEYGPQAPGAVGVGIDEFGIYADHLVKGVHFKMRWIWPGEFMMGSPEGEEGRFENETQHEVILTQGFWLGETTCTQALWEAVMVENPSRFKGPEHPVEGVSWIDAVRFLTRLNEIAGGDEFRLPSEAEWEYACRAGTRTSYWWGDEPGEGMMWCNQDWKHGSTKPAKHFAANPWGLYQMHGNVWEWCADWYGDDLADSVVDPVGPALGEFRVLRGGSWFDIPRYARSAARYWYHPANAHDYCGFRLARGPSASAASKARAERGERERTGGVGAAEARSAGSGGD